VPVLDHLLVLTDDIDATRDFWCAALGLDVGERPPLEFPGYWLYGAEGPCVHVADRTAYEEHSEQIGIPAAAGPVEHVAFDAPDYEALVARVEREGIDAARNAVPGVMRQLFVQDPNGVKIEINVKEDS
jgi:catechol 2,3-dioxygenase-like lactoylglutathione lyase family enzyme